MDIPVNAKHETDGWYLCTDDESADVLAGPFDTAPAYKKAAKELGLAIAPKAGKTTVAGLRAGQMFRADSEWYKLVKHDLKKKSVVEIVGAKERGEQDTASIDSDTEVSEISVRHLR